MGPLICQFFSQILNTVIYNLQLVEIKFWRAGYKVKIGFSTVGSVSTPNPCNSLFKGNCILKLI